MHQVDDERRGQTAGDVALGAPISSIGARAVGPAAGARVALKASEA